MNLSICLFILLTLHQLVTCETSNRSVKKCKQGGVSNDKKFKDFVKFIKKYNKHYLTVKECVTRFKIFKENMKKAKEIQKLDRGTAVYGVTIFSDLSSAEFQKSHLGLKFEHGKVKRHKLKAKRKVYPSQFDWRDENVLNPVQNQGHFKTCYAFSMMANLESTYAVKHTELYKLSEQQLVDCDQGDQGGFPSVSVLYLKEYGAMRSEDYPYVGTASQCDYDPNKVVVKPDSSAALSKDENILLQNLVDTGPLSAAMNATFLQFLINGILDVESCDFPPNHAVNLVGYGVEEGSEKPYWIVRNSWGPDWSEEGYFRIARGKGMCQINQDVITALFN